MLTVHAASTRIPHTPAHGTGHQHVLSESDSLHQTAQSPTASHTAASKPTCRAAARAWLSTSRTASRSRAAPAPSTNASHAHNGPATRYQPPAGGSVERSMPRKMTREAVAAGASSARTQASRGSRSRPVEVNRRTILAAHAPKSSHTQSMAGSTVSDCSTPVSRSLPNTPSALSARTSAEPQSPELPYARAAMAPHAEQPTLHRHTQNPQHPQGREHDRPSCGLRPAILAEPMVDLEHDCSCQQRDASVNPQPHPPAAEPPAPSLAARLAAGAAEGSVPLLRFQHRACAQQRHDPARADDAAQHLLFFR
eukprot:856549-Rhodomonas_salina.1